MARLPYVDDPDFPPGVVPFVDDPNASAPMLPAARVPGMLPQDPGPAPALMQPGAPVVPRRLTPIGDATPLGRFAQPILPPPPQPMVQRAPTGLESQRDKTQGDLEHLQTQDKDPYGSPDNHPGFGGKLLHGLASFGNVAGAILAPNVERAIPGSKLNRMDQESTDLKNLETLSTDASTDNDRDATTRKTDVETAGLPEEQSNADALSKANAAHLGAETTALQHPVPKDEFELWHAQNPNGTAQDFEEIQKQPLSAQDAADRNAVWDPLADKYHLPKGQFRAGMSGANAAALAAGMNQVVGRDQGGTKINIQQQAATNAGDRTRNAETEKEYNAAAKDLGSQFSTAQTQAETLAQARQELQSGAVGQAVGTIKTLVGLAGGKGTGVRITQAELNALAQARGLGGSFEGYISSLEGKGKLAPEQVTAMTQLLGDVENTIRAKMGKQDQYLDRLSQANSAQEVRQIQSEYRKDLMGGKGGGGDTGTIRARDPQGKLHEAPAGTALPAGWKKE